MRRGRRLIPPLCLLCWSAPALAQPDVSKDMADPDLVPSAREAAAALAETEHPRSDKVIIPIPISQPALGTGLAVVGVLFHNPKGEPTPWVTGIGAGYASSGTWVVSGFRRMSLGQDSLRLLAFAGYANARLKFYGVGADAGSEGEAVDVVEHTALGLAEGQLRLARTGLLRRVFAGARMRFRDTKSREDDVPADREQLPDAVRNSGLFMIGPAFTLDSRDSSFSPSKGVYVTGSWLFATGLFGGDYKHRKLELLGNTYFPLGRNTVLGVRKSACSVSGEAPYYDLCLFGQHNDLRGYETGRYRDKASWALQAEVRQHLAGKLGAVAFAGVGGIAASSGDIWKHSSVLASGGFGVRYMASEANRVNLRADLAFGKDGAAFYFGIGEAF